jgi:hypothetical protein
MGYSQEEKVTADQASKIRGALSLIHFSKYDWRVVQEQCRIIEHILIEIEYQQEKP